MAKLVAALFLLCGHPVWAQDLPAEHVPPAYARHSALVVHDDLPLYVDLDGPAIGGVLDRARVLRAAIDHLQRHPYIDLRDQVVARSELASRKGIAARRAEAIRGLGYAETSFFKFELDQAIKELELAIDDFEASHGEFMDSEALARAYQTMGFSLLEKSRQGQAGVPDSEFKLRALSAMREMVRLAPSMVLREGRQTAERVELYQEARRTFLENPPLRVVSQDKAKALATALDIDYLFYMRIVQDPSGVLVVEVDVYDRQQDTIHSDRAELLPETSGLSLTDEARERLDAVLSRFSSCIVPKPAPKKTSPSQAGRLYIDTGFAYFLFLESPTSSPFDNIGASFRATWMVTNNFFISGRVGLAFSGNDLQSDLQSTFNTFRGSVGVGVSSDLTYFRPYLMTAIEVAKPTAFVVTQNTSCKTFGVQDAIDCAGDYKQFDVSVLTGVQATAGASVGLEPIFFTAEVTGAFYVLPVDEGKDLNFPFGFDLGLEYRF